ncbi:MAG: PIG-L family deacetylase [Anaerolineae bacterium]|nr:PIG-L family deacetylase [Anaerolineae bacterium]
MANESEKTILAVLAHPDDETFGMGGTLALYAHQGAKVHLICATRGEAGDVDENYLEGYQSVAERRESELRCAGSLLGLNEIHFLGYRDSGMPGSPDNHNPRALFMAPQRKVAEEVAHYIRQIRPQVVLTFDPIGGYRHPDHIAIQQATVMAFNLAADPLFDDGLPPYQAQRLYFHVMPRGFLRFMVKMMPLFGKDPTKFGRNGDIDMKSITDVSFPTHVRIDYRPVAQIRDDASACHASQGGGFMSRGFVGWLRRQFSAYEAFMQAFPEPANAHIKKDLFDGVVL